MHILLIPLLTLTLTEKVEYLHLLSFKNEAYLFFPAEIPAVAVIEEHSVQPEQLPG